MLVRGRDHEPRAGDAVADEGDRRAHPALGQRALGPEGEAGLVHEREPLAPHQHGHAAGRGRVRVVHDVVGVAHVLLQLRHLLGAHVGEEVGVERRVAQRRADARAARAPAAGGAVRAERADRDRLGLGHLALCARSRASRRLRSRAFRDGAGARARARLNLTSIPTRGRPQTSMAPFFWQTRRLNG